MRRIISMVLLAIIVSGCNKLCGESNSKWVKFAENDLGSAYSNPTSVRKVGDITTMWTMLNFYDDPRMKSSKLLEEFDCKSRRSKTIYSLSFSETMGDGKLLSLEDTDASSKIKGEIELILGLPSLYSTHVVVENDNTYKLFRNIITPDISPDEKNYNPGSFGKHRWELACGEK